MPRASYTSKKFWIAQLNRAMTVLLQSLTILKKSQKMTLAVDLQNELQSLANPAQAKVLQRFFKTDLGQYGEGDVFLGIKVPIQRQIAKKYSQLNFQEITTLLGSKIHEYRLIALFILIGQYDTGDDETQAKIYKLYIKNRKNINNWDLVDLSAPNIVGKYLLNRDRQILYKLALSNHLWSKRIAVLATFEFIKNGQSQDIFALSKILLKDKHDLIHKAVGWMLREVGKRIGEKEEEKFLQKYSSKMPRTMLRYAIERFRVEKRVFYLKKK